MDKREIPIDHGEVDSAEDFEFMLSRLSGDVADLGDLVIDIVSRYTGIVVCKCVYLSGCVSLSVQGRANKDNVIPDCQSFDEAQLRVILKDVLSIRSKSIPDDITGGPEVYSGRVPYNPRW